MADSLEKPGKQLGYKPKLSLTSLYLVMVTQRNGELCVKVHERKPGHRQVAELRVKGYYAS